MLNFHTLNITYNKYMTISICMGLMIIYTESVNVFQHQQFCYFDLLQNTWIFFYCLMIVSDYNYTTRMDRSEPY
jgi:hypothetical protein